MFVVGKLSDGVDFGSSCYW